MKKYFVFLFLILTLGLASCTKSATISFTDEVIDLKVGETKKINYEVTKGKDVEFSLPNETIARIDGDNITGVSVGEVLLTATIKGTKTTATITVKVSKPVDTVVDVTNITIAGKNAGLVGEEVLLTATVVPDNATDKTVTWSSSDDALATVVDGKVALLKAGEVTIKAVAGGKEATHVITITEPVIDVESITISGDDTGFVGEEILLTATVLPENAADKTITWESSDFEVAVVSQGKVTLLKAGQVTITAKAGGKEATHVITVSPILADSVTVTGLERGFVGETVTLTATILPENTTDKTIVWSSSDETLATVEDGVVTLLKAGDVTIKAKVGEVEGTHAIKIENVLPESIAISGLNHGYVGDEITLTATILPENTTDKTIIWTSSDETIATVVDGVVTLLSKGAVTIKAQVGEKVDTHEITVDIPVESITITGANIGLKGDVITLEATLLPEEAQYNPITWRVNIDAFATVENGVVTLLRKGEIVVTVSAGGMQQTHEITINNPVAMIGEVAYPSIQMAIDAATATDIIKVLPGIYNEALTINKSDVSITGLEDKKAILTNKISIGENLENISFTNLSFTGDAHIRKPAGTLKGFTFKNNHVYDTNLEASAYKPITRLRINAFIEMYTFAGTNIHGNFYIEDNIFENIQSDIMSIDRTMVDTVIDIKNNLFKNYGVSVVKFDGGYNNGTYNIINNTFENDELSAYAAINFRAYSSSEGNIQIININENTFKNIGDPGMGRDGDQPGSGVITFSIFNDYETHLFIKDNTFTHTFNSIHLRGNAPLVATVTGNTFKDTLGYMYFENGSLADYSGSIYLDRLGEVIAPERILVTGEPNFRQYDVAEPVLESFTLAGDATGETTDEMILDVVAVPPYYVFDDITWTSSDNALATVENGIVKLLAPGTVTITATVGELSATHDITITTKMAAKIGAVAYATIQAAIDAAVDGDIIEVNYGVFSETLTISKAITLKGYADQKSILTSEIVITPGTNGVTIDGFKMTGDIHIVNEGLIEEFTFINNHVYDTDLKGTPYAPSTRTNVNAIIQLYSGAGTDKVGNITIEHNVFERIQSDIIAMDRTKVGQEINIRHNQFRNFKVGVIRFDGGYNNGTYNITNNVFENDVKQAEAAITFRAYSSSAGNVQIININENTFKNIGNEQNNPTGSHPASAVIGTSTYNSQTIVFNITNNNFVNTHNSVHLRKNEETTFETYGVTVSGNTFRNPTGYMFVEDGNIAKYELNTYLDAEGIAIPEDQIEHTSTTSQTKVKLADVIAEYVVLVYTFNPDTKVYDVESEVKEGVVGEIVKITIEPKEGYYTDGLVFEGQIKADGSLVIEIYYHIIEVDPNAFNYALELNGGNLEYETRRDLVDDFINDYNTVNGKSYTLETLGMGIWADVDYHNVFYHVEYRDKWLWLADYLGKVGSSTNRQSARDVVSTPTKEAWTAISDNWIYAFSYEMRGFLKGIHFTANTGWPTSDYSNIELRDGFWPTYAEYRIPAQFLSKGAVEILPIAYKDGFEFIGWFINEDLSGEPVTEITEAVTKVYAKYEEKNPVTGLEIVDPITELLKGATHQLVVTITPADAFNKTLLYYSSDEKIAVVSEEGLITALNVGEVTIKVTNYNGQVETTMTITVIPNNDMNITYSEDYTGHLQVNDTFTMDVEGIGKDYAGKAFTYQVVDETILEFATPNQFTALLAGETTIDIYDGATKLKSIKVVVQGAFNEEDRVDQLLELLANANNPIAQGLNVILVHQASGEYSQPKHESVNAYLFDDLNIDRETYLADPLLKASGLKPSTEFIVLHDTANINGGLISHGNFFKNPANAVSIHYTTGDYGVLQTLDEAYIAWHAGDGTTVSFEWLPTGLTAANMDTPEFDISVDGFFTINGQKTTVLAPKDNGKILDKTYFTYQGPTWAVIENQYHIGTHWFTRGQQTYGAIATRGGNRNSVGIEMNVNKDGDSIDTLQRTAKLVAGLLEKYNLHNSRVITHNTTDGKGDSYMLNNTVYNGSWYFPRFMEHVEVERQVLKNFSDAEITFSSESPLVSETGRVIAFPEETTAVEYTITVKIGEVTKSITLVSVVPGVNTWNQTLGMFVPTQGWAKADYRVGI